MLFSVCASLYFILSHFMFLQAAGHAGTFAPGSTLRNTACRLPLHLAAWLCLFGPGQTGTGAHVYILWAGDVGKGLGVPWGAGRLLLD